MFPSVFLYSLTVLFFGLSFKSAYGPASLQVLAVPVDVSDDQIVFYLPETNSRKALCPSNQTSALYRYDKEIKKCFKTGERGPCGENMIFSSKPNSSIFGHCDCDYASTSIPMVFHEPSKRCFQLFTKAYCNSNEWLTLDTNYQPQCEEDKCQDTVLFGQAVASMIVPFKGRCVSLNSRHKDCRIGEVVTFKPDEFLPSCVPKESEIKIVWTCLFCSTLKCKPGSIKIHGRCRPVISSKFDRN